MAGIEIMGWLMLAWLIVVLVLTLNIAQLAVRIHLRNRRVKSSRIKS